MRQILESLLLKGRLLREGKDGLGRKIQHYLLTNGQVLEIICPGTPN